MRSETSGARRIALGLLLAGLTLCLAHLLATRWERVSDEARPGVELALFPNGPWVKPATMGRARVAADLAWLEAIQYYGKHRKTDRMYPFAETLFSTLVALDPQFENAYVLGALILSEDVGRFDVARGLLEAGVAANPESWRLTFELGFLCYVRGTNKEEAAGLLRRAARMPGAPSSVTRLAAFAAGQAGDREMAIALWTEVYRMNENSEVRRIAGEYLATLGVDVARWEGGTP